MKKKHFQIYAIIMCSLCLICYFIGRVGSGSKIIHQTDTVYVESDVALFTPHMDSVFTQGIMEKAIISNHIDYHKSFWYIYQRKDMEYLPYFFLTFSSSSTPPLDVEKLMTDYIVMCTARYDDKALFELGRKAVDKLNKRIEERPEKAIPLNNGYTQYCKPSPIPYPDSFSKNNIKAHQEVSFTPSKIDTLRVKAIAHNDRKALRQLEKYYQEIGYDLGIAIYYKVLLCRDGNGDIAERLYRLLKPYFYDRPELENVAHDALIRAAICDRDKRAQELCDSLGYSLCDYKSR